MRRFFSLTLLALACLVTLPARAQDGEDRVRAYMFGNSLVAHPSDAPDTNIPIWLARLARGDGRLFSVAGKYGFLRGFAKALPPTSDWYFRGVRGAWNPNRHAFGAAGFNRVLIAPANFIQYQAPDKRYDGRERPKTSPLKATLALVDWLADEAPDARIVLYQGWADMAGFSENPPEDPAALAEYYAYNAGEYDAWYGEWLGQLRAARPGAEITLAPVARVLAQLLTETALKDIAPTALYTDNAPHGTETLYLLAAMITYPALFDAPVPEDFQPPEKIHRLLRDNYPAIARAINGLVLPEGTAAAAAGTVETPNAGPDDEAQAAVAGIGPARPLRAQLQTGLDNPALAMGLSGISDWSVQHPFIDIFKSARGWIGHRPDEWGAWRYDDLKALGVLDENGWPTRLPEGATHLEALILTDQPPETAPEIAGRYRVTWDGQGTLRVLGRATNITRADREIRFDYTPGDDAVGIAIFATDPEGTGDYIRNITVLRESQIPLWQAGALFNPDWLARIADLRAVRFMDWMQTNNSQIVSWGDRPKPDDFSWGINGVPVEVMVQLANEIGADPWFTMPHLADDDYNRRFAEYVRRNLDPRLVAYVEYSNELWNFLFEQTVWASEQAKARWGKGGEGDGWMQYVGMRASQVMQIWSDTYGDAAPARLKRVVAVHTGWPGLEEALLEAPLYRAESPDNPRPADLFDAYAVSGYFGLELGMDEMADTLRGWLELGPDAAVAEAARTIRDGSLAELLDEYYPAHARVAAENGLELIMYEGGTHVVGLGAQQDDPALEALYIRLNYSDEMALLYDELLSGWRAAGGTLFNAFVDVAWPSKYGSWGARRYLDDENPRARVLDQYNAAGADWGEARAPGSFLQGLLRLGAEGTDILQGTPEEDTLLAGPGDDILLTNGGADHLNGGAGFDIAVLPGRPGDYRFARQGPRLVATGPEGAISLYAVEMAQFTGAPGEIVDLEALR